MLKGTVTFETFNKKGELIQKESAENMVTEAVDRILSLSPWFTDSIDNKMPIAQKLLGGLFLFDGLLTQDITNVNFPGREAKLVGMGGRLTDIQDPVRGTYDDTVSGPIENGFKSVWKFTEDQANGDIRSVALTSVNAGTGFNTTSNTSTHIDSLNKFHSTYGFIDDADYKLSWPLLYDESNQIMYYAKKANSSPYSVSVYKRRIPVYSFGVNDGGNPGNIDLIYPKEYVGQLIASTSFSYRFCDYSRPTYDGYMYYWTGTTYNYSANQFVINGLTKLNLNALKQGKIVTVSYGDVTFDVVPPETSTLAPRFTINNDCLYFGSNSHADYPIQRTPFSIQNGATVVGEMVKYPSTKSAIEKTNYLYTLNNGIVVETITDGQSGQKYCNLLYDDPLPTGATELPSTSFVRIPTGLTTLDTNSQPYQIGMCEWMYNNNADVYMFPYEHYLGTIFNLPNKVTKDDSKTMTVTYTLTNVPSNS